MHISIDRGGHIGDTFTVLSGSASGIGDSDGFRFVYVHIYSPRIGTEFFPFFQIGHVGGSSLPPGGDIGDLETFFLVQATESYDLTLEDNTVQTFEPVGFNFKLPGQNDQGIQELSIEIDNVDRRIGDFLRAATLSEVGTVVKYRPYLSNDLTTPQLDPPLELVLSDIKITETKVTARASFADIVNLDFLTKLYTRRDFPSLGNT
jgi:hypothetical protein